ncbi:hypothetical protein IFM89_024675 [Coptis chinensis]|uniref:Mechanosensitive channel protein 2/3 transmembrane domain-containing protein n=1 Tax=Coptis chinensis TaxID=261450 RepID=A0A835ID29_9MAGN|nr:hypothetical protein IFM89_024675 [Coptis chinensis]
MIVVACSLQLSHELGICNNHKHTSKLKRLDALSFHLLHRVYQPIWSSPSRLNVFICRSSVIPIQVNEIPILKTAATAVARLYNGFPGNSFVLRLVPSLVIIVFAIWGLVPLVRYGRNLFLKQSDNSWKWSGAHYVTTSYLQLLLLWTGATLICRAFDPVVLSSEAS